MFSTLGPGTLASLSALYRAQGWGAAFRAFRGHARPGRHAGAGRLCRPGDGPGDDHPDLGRRRSLLTELRTLGGNFDPARHAGLRTPRWRERLLEVLAKTATAEGRPALDFEVVYGHAFRPPPRARVAAETTVPVETLRAALRDRGSPAD